MSSEQRDEDFRPNSLTMRTPLLRRPSDLEEWQYPGTGTTERLAVSAATSPSINHPSTPMSPMAADRSSGDDDVLEKRMRNGSYRELPVNKFDHDEDIHPHLLGQIPATAISGNDILSSCLYTCGLTAAAAGVWAPVSMFTVVAMLYLFRSVYSEVCTALPLNGGAYNGLLNTTSKATASIAACLTILSYMATGVVSAADACQYLQTVWTELDVYAATIILLGFFAVLSLIGITESSVVATTIFCVHFITLSVLLITSFLWVATNGFTVLRENFADQNDYHPSVAKALVRTSRVVVVVAVMVVGGVLLALPFSLCVYFVSLSQSPSPSPSVFLPLCVYGCRSPSPSRLHPQADHSLSASSPSLVS